MMSRPSMNIALVLACLANCVVSQQYTTNATSTSIVDLGYARYQASLDPATGITNFLGVRYAAPPTGTLRWQAPQPPSKTSKIVNADTQPNWCYQPTVLFGQEPTNHFSSGSSSHSSERNPRHHDIVPREATTGKTETQSSEDCLFLNVHVPGSVSSNPKSKYPVVVWIHGGGYVSGAAELFDGAQLVLESDKKVISVVIQYRLGIFGFLAGSKVKAGGALNAGLLDQQFALKWVQSHISSFGGDSSRVTIWGESAGGGSVIQHIIANNGQTTPSLFKNAILSSAAILSQYNFNDRIPEEIYSEALTQTNCSHASYTLTCLRSTDVTTLVNVNNAIHAAGLFGTYTFLPVVDGDIITRRPSDILASGKVNGDLLLSVTNAAEGIIFINTTVTGDLSPAQYAQLLFPTLNEQQTNLVGAQYAKLPGSDAEKLGAIYAEAIFLCPSYNAQNAFNLKSWKGEFAIPPAIHGQDLLYYFKGFILPGATFPPVIENPSFVASFAKSFLSFVVSENPNAHIDSSDVTPFWAKYNSRNRTELVFNVTESGGNDIHTSRTDAGLVSRCKLWNTLSSSTHQ